MRRMSSRPATRRQQAVPDAHVDAVMRASRAFVGIAAASVADVADVVTVPQLRILTLIDTRGPLNVNAVAAAMRVAPSNASRACDRLMKAGLIDRRESPGDRRNVTLTLTDAGHELIEHVTAHRRAAIKGIMRQIGAPDWDRLTAAFDDFATAAGEPPDDHHLTQV